MAKNSGWVPQQHGAWAMLAVPSLLGCWLRLRGAWGTPGGSSTSTVAPSPTGVPTLPDDPIPLPMPHPEPSTAYLLPLVATMFLGWFAFSAASLWLKAKPIRRRAFVAPTLTWAGLAAITGVTSLVLAGPTLLWWAPWFGGLTLATLALVKARRERALASGALTVLAASTFLVALTHPDLRTLGADPSTTAAVGLAAICFAYFLGTVFSVKSLIRGRGDTRWWAASVGWHALATTVAAVAAGTGHLTWAWSAFFFATTIRAALLPWLQRRGTRLTPMAIGLVEVGFSLALVVLALTLPTPS